MYFISLIYLWIGALNRKVFKSWEFIITLELAIDFIPILDFEHIKYYLIPFKISKSWRREVINIVAIPLYK